MLGLAGIAGVAATGAVLVRAERRRQALTPDDVRARLHARHAEAQVPVGLAMEAPPKPMPGKWVDRWRAQRKRSPAG